jgi:hypothetical protein
MSTKIFSPNGMLPAFAMRQVLENSPVLLGALKRTDISTSSPGATAGQWFSDATHPFAKSEDGV